MNDIITRLLDWCYEHDYEVSIDTKLKDKPFPYVRITLSKNNYHVQQLFRLYFSENENLYPSTKWFDKGLDYELQSFLEFAENRFSEHDDLNEDYDVIKKRLKNNGEV